MSPVNRPIILTGIAVIAVVIAVYITGSAIERVDAGVEVTPRGVSFPVFLWFIAIVATGLAVIRWVQWAHYVRATTPEERVAARAQAPVPVHRPGDELDYGTRLEDTPK